MSILLLNSIRKIQCIPRSLCQGLANVQSKCRTVYIVINIPIPIPTILRHIGVDPGLHSGLGGSCRPQRSIFQRADAGNTHHTHERKPLHLVMARMLRPKTGVVAEPDCICIRAGNCDLRARCFSGQSLAGQDQGPVERWYCRQ